MSKVRHVLGLSGGKDSAALAIYLNEKHPELDLEYYFCDTGKELEETYDVIHKLEVVLGKEIIKLKAAKDSPEDPFDHHLAMYGGYLPSSTSRWCTKKLKLEPFEEFVGDDPVVSYVGIRGDENREGYISTKPNIQSVFPFRKNLWSQDIIRKVLNNDNIEEVTRLFKEVGGNRQLDRLLKIVQQPLSEDYDQMQKLDELLDIDVVTFNKVVQRYLKEHTDYPLGREEGFSLLENEDVLVRKDIFALLEDSGVGIPQYYEKVPYEVDGKKGYYARSRSGCYFCFFQRKIEWVWLCEQHAELFKKAQKYEKNGFSWMDDETLEELAQPERRKQIKRDHIKKTGQDDPNKSESELLVDIIADAEGEGCAACFI